MKAIFYFAAVILCVVSLQAKSQGLGFQSTQKSTIAKRTSYTVFASNAPVIYDEFTISFELSILDPKSFGFICTMGGASKALYSLSYVNSEDDVPYLKLNREGEKNLLSIRLNASELGKGKWLGIQIECNVEDDTIRLLINNELYRCKGKNLSELLLDKLFFGKHDNIIDIPSFAIRNLIVNTNRQKYRFTFHENTGNIVSEQEGKSMGKVDNPNWLINDAFHWKHRFTYTSNEIVAANYDNNNTRILIAEKDSIAFYDMVNNVMEKEPYLNRMPVPVRLGMSFLLNDQLFVYEVNDVVEGFPSIASIDLDNYEWKPSSYLTLERQRHHHNAYLDSENQQFYIFGGFGNKRLSSSFNRYNIVKDTWDTVDFKGDEVSPRYFSGMAVLDHNNLLLFGGIGNETGDQSIGRKYYYDCYQIDIENRRIKKLWDVDRPDINLVSSRDMVISDDSTSFYTLCYPEYIPQTHVKLHQYDIETGAFSVLGDSIPITSERIRTYANLYSNTQSKELYCVVMEITGEDDTKVSVYSIDNPPMGAEVLFEQPQKEEGGKRLFWWIMNAVLLISSLIILLIGFLIKRKKRLIAKRSAQKDAHQPIIVGRIGGPQKNSIYIFGVFTVFDRQGTDITHLFSPQVKQLFLFILLKSCTDGEGVASEHIYNSVWPDKPLKNAKNLKGVTLNKLRNVLADIDGIDLLYENQSFRVESSTPFYCDYLEYKLAYQEFSSEINDLNAGRITEITSRGQFLKSVNNDYFDPFKKEVSDQIIGIVPIILKQNFEQKNYSKTISIASILYLAEELNEWAFYYILKSYLRLGDKTAAKKHYIDYVVRYQKIMGENYNIPYQEAISNAKKIR